MENPYEPPVSDTVPFTVKRIPIERPSLPLRGKICSACGSGNTADSFVLRSKPSLLFALFFGWLFILIRSAFSVRTAYCRDCGAATRYRTGGSKISIVILLLIVAGIISSVLRYR
jgi:ribosomal protein L37E